MARDSEGAIERKADLARAGLRIAGGGIGAYLGTVFGPEAGAMVAQSLSEASDALVGRLESNEKLRLERTLLQINREVSQRQQEGSEVRPEIVDGNSPEAIALLETVVEAAARSIEEKKAAVVGNMYASIAFDDDVSISDALLYVRRVREASWRQLVALRYFEVEDRLEERQAIGVAGGEGSVRIHPALGVELAEVGRGLELIGLGQKDGSVANPANTMGGGQITSNSVLHLRATGLGETISRLGRLEELVSNDELDAIARDLRSG